MPTIQEKQAQVVALFSRFPDWEARYKYLIQMGKALPPLDKKYLTEENRVKGCQSQTWLYARLDNSHITYLGESDAMIVRGLVKLLLDVFSGHTPSEILAADVAFLKEIGLTTHLSQSRANGLSALVKQFKNYAIAFSVLLKQKQ